MDWGFVLESGSQLTLTGSVVSNADTAIRIDGGQIHLDGTRIMGNRTGIDVKRVMQMPAVAGRESSLGHNDTHIPYVDTSCGSGRRVG